MSPESTSSQIENDVRLIVGGNFSKDALGRAYDAILARARARPANYLSVFERLFVSRRLAPSAHSNLHLPHMLEIVADLQPQRVRQLANALLRHYDSAMSVADSLVEEDGSLEALPPATSGMAKRLGRRRNTLRRLAQPAR